uniref:Uncharacterized protein n=1 Tax=Nelumbo nucifera TaxID=4432 RepID=A0A822Z2D4_NELNU|nr:TPA_asm: hypothetical protein HUJ06_008492 [Nelumbo nucifera]
MSWIIQDWLQASPQPLNVEEKLDDVGKNKISTITLSPIVIEVSILHAFRYVDG